MKWKALQVFVLAAGVAPAAMGQMMYTVTPENQPLATDPAAKLKLYSDLNQKLAADTDGADSVCLKSYADFQACKAGDPKAKCGKAPKCSVTAPLTMVELSGIRFHFTAGSDAATLEPLGPIVVYGPVSAAPMPNTLSTPTKVPKEIQMVKEDAPPSASASGVAGMSGGVPGGVLGGTPVSVGLAVQHPPRAAMISGGVISGNIVTSVQPTYPAMAKLMHLSGKVVLRALLTKEGRIDSLSVSSATNPVFEMAAVNAVRQWVYKPYVLNGEPTMVDTTVTVHFTLGGPAPAAKP